MIEAEGVVVVDASALVELVIEGEHRAGADALLDRYRTVDTLVLVTAAHGLIEATSAMRRLTQRGALSPEQGSQSLSWLSQIDVVLDATAPRLRRVWALREQMSAYDAAYAAAAEALDSPLITTDGRLLAACGSAGIAAAHLSAFAAS